MAAPPLVAAACSGWLRHCFRVCDGLVCGHSARIPRVGPCGSWKPVWTGFHHWCGCGPRESGRRCSLGVRPRVPVRLSIPSTRLHRPHSGRPTHGRTRAQPWNRAAHRADGRPPGWSRPRASPQLDHLADDGLRQRTRRVRAFCCHRRCSDHNDRRVGWRRSGLDRAAYRDRAPPGLARPAGRMTAVTDRSSEPLLVDVRRLTHVYRTPNEELVALRDLNLHLTEAERVAIVGPSGCGKTTLLNILAGLEIPRVGAVRVAGRDLATMSEPERDEYRRGLVGYAWQRVELGWWPKLTVTENVQLPMLSVVKSGRRRRHRARALLQGVGLGQRLTRVPAELSYGEKRRLALAIALANRPRLLLADEVTAGFDDEAADGLLADLNVLLRELGTSAIIVAHGRHLPRHVNRILPLPYPRPVARLARARRAGQVAQSDRLEGSQAVRRDVLVADSVSRSRPSPEGPVEVVRAASLRVKTNEMVAVLGGSGAGKSTLLALCAGLDEPDAGTVTIAGQKVTGLRGAARGALLQHAVGWI